LAENSANFLFLIGAKTNSEYGGYRTSGLLGYQIHPPRIEVLGQVISCINLFSSDCVLERPYSLDQDRPGNTKDGGYPISSG
jgi:hypothetical protein